MKKAAIYARVSSQRQKDQETIESQLEALLQFAKANDLSIPSEWVFKDDGISGASLVRAGLERLRDLVSEGILDTIIILSPDRLARKYHHQVLLLEEFARANAEVRFIKSPSNATPEDNLLLQIQGMFAEYERAQIAERSRRGRKHKAQNGCVNVLGRAPYGYRYIKKSIAGDAYFEIIDREAEIVRFIFNLYTREQTSIWLISKQLQKSAIPSPTGGKTWSTATLYGMLKNPAYMGKAHFGRRTKHPHDPMRLADRRLRDGRISLKGKHSRMFNKLEDCIPIPVPAIITDETYQWALETMSRNKALSPRNTKNPTLLQGLLVCGKCGYAYLKAGSGRLTHYRCGAKNVRCGNKRVRQQDIDDQVWNSVFDLLKKPELIQGEIERRISEMKGDAERVKSKQLDLDISRIEDEKNRLLDGYQAGCLNIVDLKERLLPLDQREKTLRKEANRLTDTHVSQQRFLEISEAISRFSELFNESERSLSLEEKRKVLRLLIRDVEIHPDEVIVNHTIPFQKSSPNMAKTQNAQLHSRRRR